MKTYRDNGNGTVTDNVTGLMWQQEDDNIERTWEEALTYCEGLTLAGNSGWRLPNIKELRSIVDNTKDNGPSIDTTYFPNTNSSRYWSSTTNVQNQTSGAWLVSFSAGGFSSTFKSSDEHVRCVR